MELRGHLGALLLASTVGLAGCSLESGPTERDIAAFDAAVVAADGALENLEMMHGPRLGLPGGIFPALVGGRPDCPRTQDVFLCDPVEREGITYTRSIRYLDAAGNAQDAYDEATTASIEYEITVQGERDRERWSATIDRSHNLIVSGLLDGSGTVAWNGSGSGTIARSRHVDDGVERSYEIVSTSEFIEVTIPYPRAADSWPISGTITTSLTMTRTSGNDPQTVSKEVSVDFNGTSEVPVTADGETFILDLTQRMSRGRHMGRNRP
jgi:hypothetical protein